MNNLKENSKIAANWWRQKIDSVDNSNFDNGEPSMAIAMMIGTRMQMEKLDTKVLDRFEKLLEKAIYKELKHNGYLDTIVSCDYHPEGVLKDISRELGIREIYFPIKTVMWISQSGVKVRAGYSAEVVTLC